MKNKEEKGEWVVGGKNVDEDPHFSYFYLSKTANDPSEVANYGEVYAVYDKFNETYFVKKDECISISKRLLEKIKKDEKFMTNIDAQIRKCCDDVKDFVYQNLDFIHSPKKYSIDHVFKLYKKHNDLTESLYNYSRVPQALDRGTSHFTNYLLAYLRERDPVNYMSYFHVLSTPETPTELLKADFDENKIVKGILKANKKLDFIKLEESKWFLLIPPKIYDEIQEFLQTWGHFDYHGYGNRRLTNLQDFIIKIKEDIQKWDLRADSYKIWIRNIRKISDSKKEIVKKLNIDSTHLRLFKIYGDAGVVKIYRRSAQIINFILLDKIIEYFSDKMNLSEYIIRFMTPPEVIKFIKTRDISIVKDAKKRFPRSIYHYKGEDISFIIENDKIKKESKKFGPTIKIKKDILSGITANLGNIKAKARVIYRPTDPFVEGEILVSESTDPDLTPIMRKASAILTEQGGATSHACIIARELNKPCIVGVEDLLSSVKTGDILQVSGEEGSIKIIKEKQNKFIKDLIDIGDKEIKFFGGKALGLHFLVKSGFANYLPLTYCGRYDSRDLIFSEQKSSIIKKELDNVLNNLNGNVAIRSSGLGEDSKTQSWAGQYLTLLNVSSKVDPVMKSIKKIYLDADKITSDYMSKEKIKKIELGFLVQEQVEAKYAGVCFTKDPITNNKDLIFIEVVEGLGESLVSGKKKPLTCKFRKSDLEILYSDKNIDSNLLKVLKELAKLATRIEKRGNNFFDVEFAVDGNMKLYLLQARPITT